MGARLQANVKGTVEALLQEFKRGLQAAYGARLKRVILYGSHARGKADEGSDVDVLVVLDRAEDPLAERERLSELIFQLSLKYNVVLSVLTVDEKEFERRASPLFLNVKQEGLAV